jgi:cell division septation protein DedD
MNNDDSRPDTSSDMPKPDQGPAGGRREPVFSDFDEDEDYEESDRDTDYASAYDEEESDEEDYLEAFEDDEPEDAGTEWQVLGDPRSKEARPGQAASNPFESKPADDPAGTMAVAVAAGSRDEPDEEDYPGDESEDEAEEDWDDQEDYSEEQDDYDDGSPENGQRWPLGLVAVAIVALLLLAAGGYGVIQQRSAAQEEIRQLQASLATAANPAEVAALRETLRESERRNAGYEETIDALTIKNRRLADMVAGLEKQLATQVTAAVPAVEKAPVAATPAKARPKTAPAAATSTRGEWFVNFSSYSQRSTADTWVKKLRPSAGKAIVTTGTRDGKTFYRVRIVGLADRAQAQKVAGQLASTHGLPPLWVGKE